MNGLELPAIPDQLAGKPVEQLGMRWKRTRAPEIIRSGDNARAEVMLPKTVHRHPRGECSGALVRIGDPVGE